jgi:drug/metabolite transporter (DMT)-like permease
MHFLLLVTAVIWGANYALIKTVLRELPPPAFNAIRLIVASSVYLLLIGRTGRTRPTRRDWLQLAAVGFYGQFVYQLCFMNGLARTTVANASLIIGLVPAVVAIVNAALGLERLTRLHWFGIALSGVGMYLVVGLDVEMSATSLTGDALTFGAVLGWAAYTIAAKPLLARHSPLVVTGWSMAFGTAFYVPYATPTLLAVDWPAISVGAWAGTLISALLALNLSYLLWNVGVQRLGSSMTSIYSNLVPVVAVASAAIWLHEPIGGMKLAGAALIILGLLATRQGGAIATIPAEE